LNKKEKEIQKAMKKDKSRLRPARKAAQLENEEWREEADKLLKRGTEEDVIAAIRRAGMDPDSPEGRNVLRVWRENRY
jgi:hypothetical protein